MTIDQSVRVKLRSLGIQDISKLAAVEFNLDLFLNIKVVKPGRERIV